MTAAPAARASDDRPSPSADPGVRAAVSRRVLPALAAGCVAACATAPPPTGAGRIVSLDYCADQFVLGLADRTRIRALSPDAEAPFSFLRAEAAGLPTVRPRAEDVLLLEPDLVVRAYGGGPRAAAFFERAGVPVLQIGHAPDVDAVRATVRQVAEALGAPARGAAIVARLDARLAEARARGARAARAAGTPARAMYLTPSGVTAGPDTFVHALMLEAGLDNFETRPGWRAIPLERLAYETPDVYAVGLFPGADYNAVRTPFRHPVAQRRMRAGRVMPIDGATTVCSAWFLADAVEALAATVGAGADPDR